MIVFEDSVAHCGRELHSNSLLTAQSGNLRTFEENEFL